MATIFSREEKAEALFGEILKNPEACRRLMDTFNNSLDMADDQCFGKMKGIGVTNIFKKNPSQIVASAPCFGEHNREVLKDFGYTDEEIDALYKKGELATWTPADTARIKNFVEWHFFWDPERQAKRIGLEYPPKK